MPLGLERNKVLYGILAKRERTHFYTIARWSVALAFTVSIAALPWTDTLRFDFWGGRHMVLGREVDLVSAAKAFAFPFLALNILILVVTRVLGRYLCGFVCPVGALARLGEWARFHSRKYRWRLEVPLLVFLASALLGAITFSFWVDWRVFVAGSNPARWIAGTFLAFLVFGLFAIVHGLGLGFCRDWCPSGVYFAILGHRSCNGIEFAHPESCTQCKACERVCPVDLESRRMAGGEYRAAMGLYGEGMSNFALCLRCGDCVLACEGVTSAKTADAPLRLGWLPPAAREPRDGVLSPEGQNWNDGHRASGKGPWRAEPA